MTPDFLAVAAKTVQPGSLPRSRLLEALPPELQLRLKSDLETVILKRGELLIQPGLAFDFIHFPTDCMISMIVKIKSGSAIESSTIGNDGFSGVSAFLGANLGGVTNMVQIPGQALRMRVEAFDWFMNDPDFRAHLGSYVARTLASMGQSAACIAFHSFHERLARWLLRVQDDIESDEISLTQEFLAMMLGVHRPTVTIAVGLLETAELITHRRGAITITDRPGLMAVACECYIRTQRRLES